MNALDSRRPRPKLPRMATAVFCCIGMAAIAGWWLPEAGRAAPAGPPAELAMQSPDREAPGTAVEPPARGQVLRNARSRVNCDGCGVIESVLRIDTRDEIIEWCSIGNSAGARVPGNAIGGDERADLRETLMNVENIFIEFHSYSSKPQKLSEIPTGCCKLLDSDIF